MTISRAGLTVFLERPFKDKYFRLSFLKNVYLFIKFRLVVLFSKKYNKVCIITLTEHMGDVIACEPISRILRESFPNYFIVWCVNNKYKELVEYNNNLNSILKVSCLCEWSYLKKIVNPFSIIYDLHFDERVCSKHFIMHHNPNNSGVNALNYYNYGNLLESLSKIAGIKSIPDITPEFYFPFEDYKSIQHYDDYIVIHAESNETDRNWDAKKWNLLCENILNVHPHCSIIEIGLKQVIKSKNSRYISLCNKLNLFENAAIIRDSLLFVGIDSGFAHFANALNKHSIILLGVYRDFKVHMPYSGWLSKKENAIIIHYPGALKDMDETIVEELINNQLELCFNIKKI
jgi:ADP-heptose:LPS heptosyltransferase